jgi:homoserine kinase
LTLYNQFHFTRQPEGIPFSIQVAGIEADRVSRDQTNLAYQSFCRLYDHLGQTPPPIQLNIELSIPLARGLGSSATAIVGGLLGANMLAGNPLSRQAVMELAIAIEGHPDNVVPALIGGCQLATQNPNGEYVLCSIPWHYDLVPILAIPNFELSTAEARRVLPTQYSRADAIFNAAHLALLVRALESGHAEWLRTALDDRIHQPYRQSLITGFEAVQSAALNVGAYGLVISGAGPTLLALTDPAHCHGVQAAIERAWSDQGLIAQVMALELDTTGAIAQAS